MERTNPSSVANDENAMKKTRTAFLDSGKPRVASAKSVSLPASISRIVEEYLPIDERYYVEAAFAGVQPITLCLSQDVKSQLAPCWSIGFLPPNHPWESSDAKIDKEYPITDFEGCLELLEQEDSNYCRLAITVLVVKLSETSRPLALALNDVRNAIEQLKHHLSSVKHVVISINECASCCYTLNDGIGKPTMFAQAVERRPVLLRILDDLHTCWGDDFTHTVDTLFAFYFKNEAKPASDKYLAKFVIPLTTVHARTLFDEEASKRLSSKIMWVYSLKSYGDFVNFDQNAPRLCHAFHVDMSRMIRYQMLQLRDHLPDILCFQDNPFIERIVIDSGELMRPIRLPRPSAPLIDAMSCSALIELTLTCQRDVLDLAELNTGFFPHLAQLSIIGGRMTGHLDSQNVPSLKTLRVEFQTRNVAACYSVGVLPREHTRAIIDTGRPWQLAALQDQTGWSLASYEEANANPQDDEKKDSRHSHDSPPLIRDLFLVLSCVENFIECQSRLNGGPPVQAIAGNQSVPLLEWAPDRVEKLCVYSLSVDMLRLQFTKKIPGKTRILTSFECHNINLEMDGVVLPKLQSLKVNHSEMNMNGTFSQLQTMSLKGAFLGVKWRLDAPCLHTLRFIEVSDVSKLSFCPQQLPHLSYLQIEPFGANHALIPTILVDRDGPGLSQIKHVVLGRGMTRSPVFYQCQVHMVLNLEMSLNALVLPSFWFDTEWQCETLNIGVYGRPLAFSSQSEKEETNVLPSLPRVKKLTLTTDECRVLLDSEMPELTDCKVPSSTSLGPNLRCPKLTCIRFTDQLSESDKEKCLDRAMYEAMKARPSWVYFTFDNEARSMSWNAAPSATNISAFAGPLEDGGHFSVSDE